MPEYESMGALIARARTRKGLSQNQLAEKLCAAAGRPTVTRHEISRWERGERVPSRLWRNWLAEVLKLPLAQLESAAAEARRHRRFDWSAAFHRSEDLDRSAAFNRSEDLDWGAAEVVTPRSVWRLVHPGVYAVVARPATVDG